MHGSKPLPGETAFIGSLCCRWPSLLVKLIRNPLAQITAWLKPNANVCYTCSLSAALLQPSAIAEMSQERFVYRAVEVRGLVRAGGISPFGVPFGGRALPARLCSGFGGAFRVWVDLGGDEMLEREVRCYRAEMWEGQNWGSGRPEGTVGSSALPSSTAQGTRTLEPLFLV